MKKHVKIIAGIVTLALALSVCSCKVNEIKWLRICKVR